MTRNYYLILRLAPDATIDQIRSAYRRRALELHPDLSGYGSDQFLELQEAYDVLSDPARREIYDREAEETLILRRHRGEPLTTAQPPARFDDRSFVCFF